MAKKGMSAAEKKMAIMKILHDSKRPHTLKDLEKIAAKAGIVQNSVKDILKELCDDDLVDTDKIGAQNFFWSFPSKETALARAKISALEDKLERCTAETQRLEERKQEILKDRPETEERVQKLETWAVLKRTRMDLENQLKLFADNDPELVRKIGLAAKEAKLASDRWTDNTQATLDWLKKTVSISRKEAERQMHLKDDFDYAIYRARAS